MRDFINRMLLRNTTGCVYICSLINDRSLDGPVERHILVRDLDRMEEFVAKWDQAGRGIFLSVSTFEAGARRVKKNARETNFLHLDLDFRDIDIDFNAAVEILKNLSLPPTYIIASGHGIHAYWGLTEPVTDGDAVEEALRKLADMLGGDRKVCQRVALMRLPGSHNTKNGQWLEVKVISETNNYYNFAELDAAITDAPVIISRKGAEPKQETNPFLDYAQKYAFKPPIDTEKRLAEMQYQGPGDTAVHATQLAVTASMLSQGVGIDEVVDTVLEATKKVAPEGWDWKREEISIRGMCKDWMRKLVKKEEEQSNVVNLAERRTRKTKTDDEEIDEADKENQKRAPKKNIAHLVLGNGFVDTLKKRGDDILICREEVWRCTQGLWVSLSPGEAKGWIERELEEGCRALGVTSTAKLVNEARQWIMRNPDIYRENVPWDEHGKIACLSGLIDPKTLEIEPIRPEHYVTMRIECFYDATAKCPVWLQMTNEIFPNEPETVMAIQEIAGTGLLLDRPRQLMRALILVGPPQSGKSNLLTILSGMFTRSPNTTTFDLLENTHGTIDFLRNVPWVLHEAFDQSKWHFSATVKALLSGDPISINIKNGPIVDRRFKLPVFWGTNSPPQFKEASRAIETRVRIVRCKQIFDPAEVTGVAKLAHDKGYSSPAEYVLDTEMPGLLNWFIEGMQRAMKRGYLADTEEMRQAARDMRTHANIVEGFFEEAVDYSSTHMVSIPDFNAAFKIWWEENRGEGRFAPSSDMIAKSIESLYDPRVALHSRLLRRNTLRYVAGIKLNIAGMSFWKARFNETAARGEAIRISGKEEDVNMKIPEEWYDKPIIRAMVEAHNSKGKPNA